MKSFALKARVHAGDGALALELDMARDLQVRASPYLWVCMYIPCSLFSCPTSTFWLVVGSPGG